MSEKNLGPKLYGMNSKARLEELVPVGLAENDPWQQTNT